LKIPVLISNTSNHNGIISTEHETVSQKSRQPISSKTSLNTDRPLQFFIGSLQKMQ